MTNPTTAPAVPLPPHDLSRIAQDLQIRKGQVEAVVVLLDEGNTVPFITRYRKERTEGLNEEQIRRIQARITAARALADRKQTVLKSIEAQGKLTDALRDAILTAEGPKRVEDLYLPYKPKKRTLASDARDKGLEPLAAAIWNRDEAVANLAEFAAGMVNPEVGLNTAEDVMAGAGHILADLMAETADVRAAVRKAVWETGSFVVAKSEKLPEGKGQEYAAYFQFNEKIRQIPPHRILAINRGERENALTVKLNFDAELMRSHVDQTLPQIHDHPHKEFLSNALTDALTRLVIPSIEREVRRELTDFAQDNAIGVFARNLRNLLLQPPLRDRRVLAIDPAFRTGCKLVALDETGNLLEHGVIFPHAPQKKATQARKLLEKFIRKHRATVIAIGNGTACRETEEFVADLIAEFDERRRGIFRPEPEPDPLPPPRAEAPAPAPEAAPAAETVSEVSPVPAAEVLADPVTETPPEVVAETPLAEVVAETPRTEIVADAPPAEAVPETPPPEVVAETPAAEVVAETPPEPAPDIPTPPAESADEAAPAEPVAEAAPPAPPEPEEQLPEPSPDLAYVIVNEAGASDYSASPIARDEFPDLDASYRGTISIGRRLQDPLAELVKIDPQHVGVGLYQHDVHAKHLRESLDAVIESCVNHVGVDLNTASVSLLRHVAGLNQHAARELVEFRSQNGPFRRREWLKQVPAIGPVRFVQAAGFLKINGGDDPLDTTWIHPESYELARNVLAELGFTSDDLLNRERVQALCEKLDTVNVPELAAKFNILVPTLIDIFDAIARPGRDPREDLPPPIFKRGVLKLEDLTPGMELKGTVQNVVPFGAFIDVGIKDAGLAHVSQLANRFIRSPDEVVAVGDVVTCWVLTVDTERKRVSLTLIPPNAVRKPPERGGPPPRGEGDQREQRRGPGQGQGPRQPRSGPPPRRGGPPPRHGDRDRAGNDGQATDVTPPQRPSERKPRAPKPLPTLTKAKREGKAYLNTLGELEAFFKSREPEPPVAPPAPPPAEGAAE